MFNQKEYLDFLEKKELTHKATGFIVDKDDINPVLFPFQRDFVLYALRKGKSAILADTGLGKTPQQLEYARLVTEHKNCDALIVSPLNVSAQTIEIANGLLNIDYIQYSNNGTKKDRITITNYENMHKFNPDDYKCVIADESSIFKAEHGKYKNTFYDMFYDIPYKLFLTATPSPNDELEISNQSECLSVMSRKNVKSTFFVHDDKEWRLKGHSKMQFYKWMASWAMAVTKPSDLGYSDEGFILPPLNEYPVFLEDKKNTNALFDVSNLKGIRDRIRVRRETIDLRCRYAAELINNSSEQWVVWCNLNDESKLMKQLVRDSVEVEGSDTYEKKRQALYDFQHGKVRVLISKPKIFGFGVNLQNSWNSVFVGLTDSFETIYQAIRRQYRFRQENPVNVYIILSERERVIYDNVKQKEKLHNIGRTELIKNVAQYEKEELEGVTSSYAYMPIFDFKLPLFLNGKR